MKNLFKNEFLSVDMVNENYPFISMIKKGTVIVPYDRAGNVYLIKSERLGKNTLELPRGFGEDIENVKSFNTIFSGSVILKSFPLGSVQADTGIMDNEVSIIEVQVNFDHEPINTQIVKLNKTEIMQYIINNAITCGYTLSGLMKHLAFGQLIQD